MKTHFKKIALLFTLSISPLIYSQGVGYNNNRIAISADGNTQPEASKPADFPANQNYFAAADTDDWGGTPAALAMIAKAGLQNRLVHFSYNNFIGAPKHTNFPNRMAEGVNGAIARWNFDGKRFFDVSADTNNSAINHLANQIKISTQSNPLYFIHMGPNEFFHRAVKKVIDDGDIASLSHVQIISHSGYNEDYLRRNSHHTLQETITLSGDRLKFGAQNEGGNILDQNACDNPDRLWCSKNASVPYAPYHWMRDHADQSLNWLYSRLELGKPDISDAGMVYFLLTGNKLGNPAKLNNFIGNSVVTPKNYTGCVIEEANDLLVFEAERFNLNGNWKIGTDLQKASGGEYIYYDGPNSYGKVNGAEHSYADFKINSAGTYTFKWTMRQPEGERGSDLGNDAWFYFTKDIAKGKETVLEQYYKFVGRSDDDFTLNGSVELGHNNSAWVRVTFSTAGTYRLKIAGRSKGFQVDRFILYKNRTLAEVETELENITETSSCTSQPVDENISISQSPSVITGVNNNLTVNYTANIDRDVIVQLRRGNAVITSVKEVVSANSNETTIAVNLENLPEVGNDYFWRVIIRPVGASWQQNIKVVDSGSVQVQTANVNLVKNPGFEAGDLSSWVFWGTVTATNAQWQFKNGSWGARVQGAGAVQQVITGLSPNTTYTLSCLAKTPAGQTASIRVRDHGKPIESTPVTSTFFKSVSHTFTTGTNATSAKIMLAAAAGSIAYGDDFELVQGSSRIGKVFRDVQFVDNEVVPTALTIYPNPATGGSIWINGASNALVVIVDMQGNIVYNTNSNSEKLQVAIDRFATGMYIVKILTNDGVKTAKLILK